VRAARKKAGRFARANESASGRRVEAPRGEKDGARQTVKGDRLLGDVYRAANGWAKGTEEEGEQLTRRGRSNGYLRGATVASAHETRLISATRPRIHSRCK
jgi:hypothetical protein